jgi:hypothetical protein
VFEHLGNDRGALPGCLALAENSFGQALAQRSMVVDARELEVGEGEATETLNSGFGLDASIPNPVDEFGQLVVVHCVLYPASTVPDSVRHGGGTESTRRAKRKTGSVRTAV